MKWEAAGEIERQRETERDGKREETSTLINNVNLIDVDIILNK